MADDQNKTSTIDDLVKELSKNNNSNQPPPNLPGVVVDTKDTKPPVPPPPSAPISGGGPLRPEPPRPLQPTSPSSSAPISGGGPSRPQPPSPPLSQPVKPPVSPMPVSGPKPSPVQEYKSSIRTMGEDIASIKSGQKPSGVDIPRKVTPEAPKPVMPGVSKSEAPPSGPISFVGLGKTEKTGPLPFLTPEKPPGPFKAPEIQPPITVPGEKKSINTTLYLFIAGVLVVGGFLYWFLVLRVVEPEVGLSPTPTPTQTVTSTPLAKSLGDIFEGASVNFEATLSDDLGQAFKTFIGTLSVVRNEFLKINLVEDVDGTLAPLSFLDMLDMDLTIYPTSLNDNIVDSIVTVYGQSEMFDKNGSVNLNTQNLKKTAFVARIKDVAAVELMIKDWELTIAEDLADYLLIEDISKEESVNFLDNTYRSALIRYKNFPFPDVTVDYAVVEVAEQNYLIITGSREAMYATMDVLLEQ